jgi:oligopeptide/dipeptide ABC transporter ATP-binding protein
MPVHKILKEAIRIGSPKISKKDLIRKVEEIAEKFELGGNNWNRIKNSKPKDLSGGERRRIGIAKVFATDPDVIIADEPVASLDVSVRGKILETLMIEWEKRQKEWKEGKRAHPLTMIIISHDFDLIQKMCHRTMVFYGDIHVKRGTVVEVFQNNKMPEQMHPYTDALRKDASFMNNHEASLQNNQEKESRKKIINTGCVYVNRCSNMQDECLEKQPPLESASEDNNYLKACFVNK